MKKILARGGIEFLAVLLGISLSLYIDNKIEESSILKNERSLLSDLQVSLNQDMNYAQLVLDDINQSLDAQQYLINYKCDDVNSMSSKELAKLFRSVFKGSTSLFPRYGVYRSLVSNSEMKYIENQDLKDRLIDLYDFKFKRYENIDPIITNLYQYGFGEYLVENFSFYRGRDLQIVEKDLFVNKEAFCKNALQKERHEFYKLLDSKNKKIGIKSFILKKTPVWD